MVGAGIAGLCLARELALRGWRVTVLRDPQSRPASSVAAGLLQVAGGRISRTHLALRQACLAYYSEFLQSLPGCLTLTGRGHLRLAGDDASRASFAATLRGLGVPAQILAAEQCPELTGCQGAVWLDDRRLDPARLLTALEQSLQSLGARMEEAAVSRVEPGHLVDSRGVRREASCVALACGAGLARLYRPGWSFQEEEGWGAAYRGSLALGSSLEAAGQTLVPVSSHEWRVGGDAPWQDDPPIRRWVGWEGAEIWRARGVRLKAPDGLPLAGRAGQGLYLLGGLGRNGLLTAPLLAKALAETIAGGPAPSWLPALSPLRARVAERRAWSR